MAKTKIFRIEKGTPVVVSVDMRARFTIENLSDLENLNGAMERATEELQGYGSVEIGALEFEVPA